MLRIIIALLSGLVFGAGLVFSGMANPQKVLAFLDLGAIPTAGWDPSLALVMAGALAVSLPGFALARRQQRPVFADSFNWPGVTSIDRRLLLGSILFGIGWGLAGVCPGPALTLLALDGGGAFVFFGAMLAGMLAFALQTRLGR